MLEYFDFVTEDGTQRVFDFGYLQKLMTTAAKAGEYYRATIFHRTCTCQDFVPKILNGIYGHPVLEDTPEYGDEGFNSL